MDGRQAVAELVGDAGGQLAEPRQAVLQPQLLFELHDLAQIGEQADRAVRARRPPSRIGETVMPRCDAPPGRLRHLHGAPHDRPLPSQALVDDVGERRRAGQDLHVDRPLASASSGDPEQLVRPAGFSVRTRPLLADDEQPGRHARDDLAAQALGGFRPRLHRALLRLAAAWSASSIAEAMNTVSPPHRTRHPWRPSAPRQRTSRPQRRGCRRASRRMAVRPSSR